MALSEKPVIGKDCKLYYNSGTHLSPTWIEIERAINVSASITKNEADVSSRESDWQMMMGALNVFEITFNYRHIQGTDGTFAALRAAFMDNTPIQFLMLDAAQSETGAEGILAFCEIMSMNPGQELEGSQLSRFRLRKARVPRRCQNEEPSVVLLHQDELLHASTIKSTCSK